MQLDIEDLRHTRSASMHNYHTWLLDLDDTLQVGMYSWAAIHVFPDIIEEVGTKPERNTFEAAYARAQEIYKSGGDNDAVGDEFFRILGWPAALTGTILKRFATDYRPALFDDTTAFLNWITARGDRLFLTTNNTWAHQVCQSLGIMHYFSDIVIPVEGSMLGKPSPDMWNHLKAQMGLTDHSEVVLVGNELTTDGIFAKNCGLDCIIVDRFERFAEMPDHCFRVTSLSDISAQVDQPLS